MTTVNTALLLKTLSHIEASPESWDQNYWAKRSECGTSHCFAGWVCALSGLEPEFTHGDHLTNRLIGGGYVATAAIELLNVSQWKAAELFSHTNTLDDLRRIVSELRARPSRAPLHNLNKENS